MQVLSDRDVTHKYHSSPHARRDNVRKSHAYRVALALDLDTAPGLLTSGRQQDAFAFNYWRGRLQPWTRHKMPSLILRELRRQPKYSASRCEFKKYKKFAKEFIISGEL